MGQEEEPVAEVLSYVGRFAPSPTGPLHLGSLVAAAASYLDARAHGGKWLVRIEDVDEPRTAPGATDAILRCLEAYGFEWDGPVVLQSQRKQLYRDALEKMAGHVFGCACSRMTGIYPGTCRNGLASGLEPRAWRCRVDDGRVRFEDRVLGRLDERLAETCGDFVVLRADGYFAYQLAVVVDDIDQGVTDIVRGADLLDSTGRQLWLRELLGGPPVRHAHIPVVADASGAKLSKQTRAPAVPIDGTLPVLRQAFQFLAGHQLLSNPPPEVDSFESLWVWGIRNWRTCYKTSLP